MNTYRFIKDYTKWKPSAKRLTVSNIAKGVSKKADKESTKKLNTKEIKKLTKENREGNKTPSCPYQSIVEIYHEVLPELPMVREITEARKRQLNSRWTGNEKCQSLNWWKEFFEYVRESPFLMGNANGNKWKANLEWLTKEDTFIKIIEGNYHS